MGGTRRVSPLDNVPVLCSCARTCRPAPNGVSRGPAPGTDRSGRGRRGGARVASLGSGRRPGRRADARSARTGASGGLRKCSRPDPGLGDRQSLAGPTHYEAGLAPNGRMSACTGLSPDPGPGPGQRQSARSDHAGTDTATTRRMGHRAIGPHPRDAGEPALQRCVQGSAASRVTPTASRPCPRRTIRAGPKAHVPFLPAAVERTMRFAPDRAAGPRRDAGRNLW